MKTKLLCVTVLIFTVLIFGANRYAARNKLQSNSKCNCDCVISVGLPQAVRRLDKEEQETKKREALERKESCSLVFRSEGRGLRGSVTLQLPVDTMDRFFSCGVVVFCDRLRFAGLACTGHQPLAVLGNSKCSFYCETGKQFEILPGGERVPESVTHLTCDTWTRPKPPPNTQGKSEPTLNGSSSPFRIDTLFARMFSPSPKIGALIMPSFLSEDTRPPAVDDESRVLIMSSIRWKPINAETGIENGALMVAKGEAEARSFCTGDSFRLAGPNVITLPTCQVDFSGRWQGAYARWLPNGTQEPVTLSLNLRKDSGSLRGELVTPDGAFNIVAGSQSGSDIRLQAERTVGAVQVKINLNGKLTKSEIVFDGSEQSPGAVPTRLSLTGFVRRLHIADSALPIATLNQPYSFGLTAFTPEDQAITFRLATPAIIQPEQITWNAYAKDLRGRNGERFTYGCPAANPSISPVVYGTDVYTDDSSICAAAVHSGLITRQAGGAVTIQIKPDAGTYIASTRNGVSSKSYGASNR